MESHIKELCARIIPDLDNCTSQDKRDAYTFLDLKISATPESIGIKGYINSKLLTIGQTWALPRVRSFRSRRV
jgi:site-specific DNA recombinase